MHKHLHQLGRDHGPKAAADYLRHSTRLLTPMAEVQELLGTAYMPILSHHTDEFVARR